MTPRPAAQWIVWMAALELFILAASNGRPFWTSSGAWVMITATVLILGRGFRRSIYLAFSGPIRRLSFIMLLFIVANVISAVANLSVVTFIEVGLRSILPFIVYLSLTGLVLRPADAALLLYALVAGAAVILLRGFFAYTSSVGNLDLQTILWARFDVQLMSSFAEVTFGNIGVLGSYILLVFPVAFWTSTSRSCHLVTRLAMAAFCALAAANLLFSGSRTALALTVVQIAVIITVRWRQGLFITILAALGLTIATISSLFNVSVSEDLIDRLAPDLGTQRADNSALERWSSVEEGWTTFRENLAFGIGPGNSATHNTFTVPHQSTIHQLSELGIIGGTVFTVLCLMILMRAWRTFRNAAFDAGATHSWIWSIGPAFWIASGLASGISFTASLALVWVGIAYAMLAVGSAKIITAPSEDNNLRAGKNFGLRGTALFA
jgi:hypothetical protein